MAPILSILDIINGLPADTIFIGKFGCNPISRLKLSLYFFYLLLCQLGLYIQLAFLCARFPMRFVALLSNAIMIVFSLGAKKQMARPYTQRIVTFVKDAKTIWNRSICKIPRKTTSDQNLSTSAAGPNSAIAIRSRSSPNPTSTKPMNVIWHWPESINFIPESIDKKSHDKKSIVSNGDCQ